MTLGQGYPAEGPGHRGLRSGADLLISPKTVDLPIFKMLFATTRQVDKFHAKARAYNSFAQLKRLAESTGPVQHGQATKCPRTPFILRSPTNDSHDLETGRHIMIPAVAF